MGEDAVVLLSLVVSVIICQRRCNETAGLSGTTPEDDVLQKKVQRNIIPYPKAACCGGYTPHRPLREILRRTKVCIGYSICVASRPRPRIPNHLGMPIPKLRYPGRTEMFPGNF